MNKTTKTAKKALSVFLAIVLVFTSTPTVALGEGEGAQQETPEASDQTPVALVEEEGAGEGTDEGAQQETPEANNPAAATVDVKNAQGDQSSRDEQGELSEQGGEEPTITVATVDSESKLTVQADSGTYRGTNFYLEYTVGTYTPEGGDLISGAIITKIAGDPNSAIVIPSQITKGETDYDVIGIDLTLGSHSESWNFNSANSITVPSSVRYVKGLALDGCLREGSFTFESGSKITELAASMFKNFYGKAVTLPDSLVVVPANMFHASKIEQILLPSSVRQIDHEAFYGAYKLNEVKLNEGLKVIGIEAFASEPSGGSYVYGRNLPLTSIAIPASVTDIQHLAFAKDVNMKSLTFDANSQLSTIGDQAFYGTSLTSVSVPDSVTSIGAEAFSGGNDTTNIGTTYSRNNRENKYTLTTVNLGTSQGTSNLTSLGSGAFAYQPITSVTLPNKLTSLGYNTSEYTLQQKWDWEYSVEGTVGAFSKCDKLATVTWPTSGAMTEVGGFDGCTSLTNETVNSLPGSVTTITDYAFYGCTSLSNVVIPKTITTIAKGAFNKEAKVAFQNGAPTYTLTNKNTELQWDEGYIAKTSPFPLASGVTIKYPINNASAKAYRTAVEDYETAQNVSDANKTKFVETTDEFYTVSGTVPAGATVTLYAGSEVLQPTLDASNSFSELVEGGKYVGAVVSLAGYKDYSISPVADKSIGILDANWSFTVTTNNMTPLSQLGILEVTVNGPYKADCNVAVFEKKADGSAGKLVSQGQALLASHSPADSVPGYVVDDIAAGNYIVVAWQSNDCFKSISSIGDFAVMGFGESDYAHQDVTITASKATRITLTIPKLDTSKIAGVLATGEVYVASLYNPPTVPFVLTVKYDMTTGQNVDSVQVNIPEGLEPTAAATSAKQYGVDGSNGGSWDSVNRVLTISSLADKDKQSGTFSIALKASEVGSYAVSASLTSGAITGPIGSTLVEVPAVKLVVPEGSLQSRKFTVHVYAKPQTDVTLKIGDTTLDGAYTTNLLGHVKASVEIPDGELSVSPYYLVTATIPPAEGATEGESDSAIVEYNAVFDDLPLQPTIHDFKFESAKQTVNLVKDGEELSGGWYTVCPSAGTHPMLWSKSWPFEVVVDSLQPLEDELELYLGMLDNSMKTYTMHKTGEKELKSGAKRYTYQLNVPMTDDDSLDSSEIPCRFDVSVMPLALATGGSGSSAVQPEWSQASVKALNVSINSDAQTLDANGRTEHNNWYNKLTDTQKSLLTGEYFLSDTYNDTGKVDYMSIAGYDYALGLFNKSYHHDTWDPSHAVWKTLSQAQQSTIEAKEAQITAALNLLAILMGNSKPMYEYASFEDYAKAEYGYNAGTGSYDPDKLSKSGYTVIYDEDGDIDWHRSESEAKPSGSAWYAVDINNASASAALTPQATGGLSTQGAIELSAQDASGSGDGVVVTAYNDAHRFVVRMADWGAGNADIDTVISGLTDLTGFGVDDVAPDNKVGGMVARGSVSAAGLLATWKLANTSFKDSTAISSELTTRENELERMKAMVEYYDSLPTPTGHDSKCEEELKMEIAAMNDYMADLRKAKGLSWTSSVTGTVLGGVGNGAGLASAALKGYALKLAAAGQAEKAAAVTGSSLICDAVSLGCTAAGVINTAGTRAAGSLIIPDINKKLALLNHFRLRREIECQKTKFGKLHYFKKPGIDPSGFTYEGVENNRVEGVVATIYQRIIDASGAETWQAWNAASMDQENPQTTGAGGLFAWDVPEGDWKVLFHKDGYDDVWSQIMHVLPEWTNVAINMLRSAAPAGTDAVANTDDEDAPYVDITFDQFMKTDPAAAPTVTVGGVAVTGFTWLDAAAGRDADGNEVQLSRVLRVPLAGVATPGVPVEVVVSGAVSYAGKAMAAPYSTTVTVPAPEYYYVTPSKTASFTKGSGEDVAFTFKRSFNDDRTFGKFTGVLVDGKAVDAANYTAVAGSVVVTMKASYLETLSEGAHVLTAQFADGTATADFTVSAAAAQGGTERPSAQDGDDSTASAATATTTKGNSERAATKLPTTGDRLVSDGFLLAMACMGVAVVIFASRRKLLADKHICRQ